MPSFTDTSIKSLSPAKRQTLAYYHDTARDRERETERERQRERDYRQSVIYLNIFFYPHLLVLILYNVILKESPWSIYLERGKQLPWEETEVRSELRSVFLPPPFSFPDVVFLCKRQGFKTTISPVIE